MAVALLIIDMQKAFFEDGALGNRQEALVAACNSVIRDAREAGVAAYVIRTEHQRDRSTWTLSMLEDGQGFAFAGTAQAGMLPELDDAGCTTVAKIRDSAFHGTDLAQRLRGPARARWMRGDP